MPDLPLVSVVVPARDAGATLRSAVQSALTGTYRNIELIIVDNGSRDTTPAIAAELAKGDERVVVRSARKSGVSAAMNAGLSAARGDYVARLDSDDLWHPTKLEKQVSVALAHPDLAFIYSFVRYIDGEAMLLHDGPAQTFPRHALCRGIYESLVGANSSALMQRTAVLKAGGYDETLASWEDLLLQLRISATFPIGYVPEYLVGYRVRPGSLSSDPQIQLSNWERAYRMIKATFPQVPRSVLRWAHARRCVGFAESFAWLGQYGKCAALLSKAMRDDPAWTAIFLGVRFRRHLKRRIAPAPPARVRPSFFDCPPGERNESTHIDPAAQSLERQRVAFLTRLDESLAVPLNRAG